MTKEKRTRKGIFYPKWPEKYVGDVNNITFRSSWEKSFMDFCDNNQAIEKWGSEELAIPYVKPTDGRVHKYIPDFFIIYTNSAGKQIKEIVEIKPLKEARLTKKSSDYDKVAYAINMAKWEAAKQFCNQNGLAFRVLTENSLFRTGKQK